MTPPAVTPAARTTRRKVPAEPKRPARAAASPRPAPKSRSHRSQLHQGIAPRTARRVSGPLAGLTRGRAAAPTRQPAAVPRRRTTQRVAVPAGAPLAARLAAYVRALPDHSLLDRIIRGRVWIPLLGVLLAGIVAMQVEVLKLNAATGVSLQRTTALQNQRDVLAASVAQLADDQRIESRAAQMGLVMPAPSQVKFLVPGSGNTGRAAGNIHQPNATAFAAALPGAALTTGGVSSPSGSLPTTAVPAATALPTLATGTTTAAGTATATGTTTAAGTATATATTTAAGTTAAAGTSSATGSTTSSGVAPTQLAAPTTSSSGGAATAGVSGTPAGG